MKSMTVLLVACGFLAGLATGMSGPLLKAGDGLARVMTEDTAVSPRIVRVTAAADIAHDGFQPADFRWNSRADVTHQAICAPKDQLGRASLPDIQHL